MTALAVLRQPPFRRYFLASVCGVNGMWIFRVLLSWSAWAETGSAAFVGLVAALSLAPVALTGPVFGTLIDRVSVRRAFVVVSGMLMLCPIAFTALAAADALGEAPLLALALFFGLAASAYHPVRQSLGPRLVEGPGIASVVALSALNFNVGRVISPALGGMLIAGAGVAPAGAISAALFVPNLAVIATLAPRPLAARARAGFLSEMAEGARAAAARPAARVAMLMAAVALGPIRALSEVLPLLADGIHGRGAEGLGLMTSCIGAGALVAAVLQTASIGSIAGRGRMTAGAAAIGFAGGLGMVWAPWFELAAAAGLLCGFASAFLAVQLQAGVQADLPDELRGRVMSLWMLCVTLSTSALALAVSVGAGLVGLPLSQSAVMAAGAGLVLAGELRARARGRG
ncbi:MFS transporter [Rhodovulum sp. DZ06]|uniref:MFS transporter n=1 Tax=Rhodovulum sp. DZ06 TaxID=3425126 RepID=UPI003D35534E